jgi:hypothetical protein
VLDYHFWLEFDHFRLFADGLKRQVLLRIKFPSSEHSLGLFAAFLEHEHRQELRVHFDQLLSCQVGRLHEFTLVLEAQAFEVCVDELADFLTVT